MTIGNAPGLFKKTIDITVKRFLPEVSLQLPPADSKTTLIAVRSGG